MPSAEDRFGPTSDLLIDGGTTNTRVWLVSGGEVVTKRTALVGVRDVVRDGGRHSFDARVRELIASVRREGLEAGAPHPTRVVAAGMIASRLGFGEMAHVHAPAGLREISSEARWTRYPGITDLDVLLVPGVRTGDPFTSAETAGGTDVMRGEETLCLGLLELSHLTRDGVLLNLGSHWKVIRVDAFGRIGSSLTSLTGELTHVTQTQTILASAVPDDRPITIDHFWFSAGMREAERSGIARALFCVRLLELGCDGTSEERFSYLLGVFAAGDLQPLLRNSVIGPHTSLAISGGGSPLAHAIAGALEREGVPTTVLTSAQTEQGMLTGLRRIAAEVSSSGF